VLCIGRDRCGDCTRVTLWLGYRRRSVDAVMCPVVSFMLYGAYRHAGSVWCMSALAYLLPQMDLSDTIHVMRILTVVLLHLTSLWSPYYTVGYAHAGMLDSALAMSSSVLLYLTVASSWMTVWSSFEAVSLMSVASTGHVHSDLSLGSAYKVLVYNGLPSCAMLYTPLQGLRIDDMATWIVCGGYVKSAIWMLHGWSLDSMCAPSLVSAPLHSCTSVSVTTAIGMKLGLSVSCPYVSLIMGCSTVP